MNKNLFLKLGLIALLSLSLVACGQENNVAEKDKLPAQSTSNSNINTKNPGEESTKTTNTNVKNADKSIQDHKDELQDKQENTEKAIKNETEDKYYSIIKEAWTKQKDYIDSIDDPKVKQSLQTPQSAAIMESDRLLIEHPEDSETINKSLKRVLNGE